MEENKKKRKKVKQRDTEIKRKGRTTEQCVGKENNRRVEEREKKEKRKNGKER